MKTSHKITIATLAGLGVLAAVVATPALSHGPGHGGPGFGPGYGYGMMGGMMGPGRGYDEPRGPGYGPGPGMMGPGYGRGPAMMGPGRGPGAGVGPCPWAAAAGGEEVTVDDVTERMEHWLSRQGNDRLKLGKVEAVDDDTITAEIVTVDDSLVQKFEIDRNTGQTRRAQ